MARRADAPHLHLETLDAWRDWLAEHHDTSSGAWLVSWRTATGRPRIDYDDAVLEALAVGWIDGQAKTIDDERGAQWYAPRRPSSGWAASNKARVQRLEAEGRMQPAGRAAVEAAKANGTWNMFDDAERLIEPPELAARLDDDPVARANWEAFPPSARRMALGWIALAKRSETRERRIAETVRQAARNVRPGTG
ncbi:YdeI/OmpD-associated family protein [Agromyces sp. H66]|uniref:YdeI/OmpD-associated family protein n=1 Tax=Agromyces sp. H66 TaxID=2529859 RepID=UPI0010AA792E|nr:YdeI/OmpD-associated family protein [Agromyces sp. H66]